LGATGHNEADRWQQCLHGVWFAFAGEHHDHGEHASDQ
jgi:hypothetical protein